jgi:hypothetical protein
MPATFRERRRGEMLVLPMNTSLRSSSQPEQILCLPAFGLTVDRELAWSGDELHLIERRPITNLAQEAA